MKVTCPQCHQTVEWEHNPDRPFCSPRCRLIDLGAWASESYHIPTQEKPPEPDNENAVE